MWDSNYLRRAAVESDRGSFRRHDISLVRLTRPSGPQSIGVHHRRVALLVAGNVRAAQKEFVDAVSLMMKTQPNYSAEKLAKIKVPVTVAQAEGEEFIKPEHAEYLAKTIPQAELVFLPGVSHFAPLQRPEVFNRAVLGFLKRIHW